MQPSEIMVLITILLVVIGGANIYAYFHALGLDFLIKDVSISMLIMSTFKSASYLIICFVLSYILFLLGCLLAFIFNILIQSLGYKDIKENYSKTWILVAWLPTVIFNGVLQFNENFRELSSLITLLFFTSTALVYREINKRFSVDDMSILIYIFLSCFSVGNYQSKIDLDIKKSNLVRVERENLTNQEDWRILTYFNDQVVLINLKSGKEKLDYKIVKFENLKFSSNNIKG
ncbi:hypothetical protein [Acinetobacter amyesii]|nr:hypothetical protein [Acinetobacter amyesii]